MTLRNKEVAPAARAPVLSSILLARVYELNRNYVELLAQPPPDPNMDAGLPAKTITTLMQLPEAARLRLAATPFALYSLGFEDLKFWNSMLLERVADRPDQWLHGYVVPNRSPSSTFCEMALFFSWHTAVQCRVAARVLFAMPDVLAERIVHTPLWRLRQIAAEFPGLLSPRWPSNPGFWPDLVRFAATGDWRRLQTAQLLGGALTAAELATLDAEGGASGNRSRRVAFARVRGG